MAEFIHWLESEQALCVSSKDYTRQKSAIEEVCYRAGPSCSFEMKQNMSVVDKRISAIKEMAEKRMQK